MTEGNCWEENLVKDDGGIVNDYLQDNKEDGDWLRSTIMQQSRRKWGGSKKEKEGSEGGQQGKREKQGVV